MLIICRIKEETQSYPTCAVLEINHKTAERLRQVKAGLDAAKIGGTVNQVNYEDLTVDLVTLQEDTDTADRVGYEDWIVVTRKQLQEDRSSPGKTGNDVERRWQQIQVDERGVDWAGEILRGDNYETAWLSSKEFMHFLAQAEN